MMNKLPTKKQLDKAIQGNVWDLGNNALYKLCRDNFEHDQPNKILAKTWIIGRSYAVALERNKKKSEIINNDFYTKDVASTFMNQELNLDHRLNNLKRHKKVNMESLQETIELHQDLTRKIIAITDHHNRSFSSKYLHFHLPRLFFIYDSRAANSLCNFISRIPSDPSFLTRLDKVDKSYATFVCKCYALQTEIEKQYKIALTPRQLDNVLIEIADERRRNTN